MSFTYAQKQALISFLSNPTNWRNLFDMAFFLDRKRFWKSRNFGQIATLTSPDGSKIIITHERNGSSLTLERLEKGILVSDELGKSILIGEGGIEAARDLKVVPIATTSQPHSDNENALAMVELSDFGLMIGISDAGHKTVFIDRLGKKILLEGTVNKPEEKTRPRGKFFHDITLTPEAADSMGLPIHGMMVGAKLVIALDMDMEPEIRLFNALDPDRVLDMAVDFVEEKWDQGWTGPWQWRPKIEASVGDVSLLQKAWSDSTEFEGHFVASPVNFYIQYNGNNSYSIGMTFEGRERVWANGHILKKAVEGTTPHIGMLTSKSPPYTLLHFLKNGGSVRDHRGQEWAYAILHAKEAATLAKQARENLRTEFGLSGREASVINFDDGMILVAGNVNALEPVFGRSREELAQLAPLISGKLPAKEILAKLTHS